MNSSDVGQTRTALALVLCSQDRSEKENANVGFLVPGQSGAKGLLLGGFALTQGRMSFGSAGIRLQIDHVTGHMMEGFCTGDEHSVVYQDEKSLLRALHDILRNENRPLLITWRGTEFDIPFLQSRFQASGLSTDDLIWTSAPLQYGLLRARHVDLWQVQCPDLEPLTLEDELAGAIVPTGENHSGIRKLEVQALGLMLMASLVFFNKKQMTPSAYFEFVESSEKFIEAASRNRPHLNLRGSYRPLYETASEQP